MGWLAGWDWLGLGMVSAAIPAFTVGLAWLCLGVAGWGWHWLTRAGSGWLWLWLVAAPGWLWLARAP